MIVVDTNILAYFWLPSNQSTLCDKLFQNDPEWVAPLLWKSEFRNVVNLYLRKKLITLPEAIQVTESAENQMRNHEFHINSSQVYSFAVQSECSAYDCEFISLAEDLNLKLATFDKQILNSFPEIAIHPSEIS